jgi:small multidrug resistance pump
VSAPSGEDDRRRDGAAADARPGRAPLFDVGPGVHEPLADLGRAAGEEIDEHLRRTHRRPRTRVRAYAFLLVAIVFGVTGTSALAQSEGFTRVGPLAVLAFAYLASFVALTRALRVIPVGIAYAIWSGVGIALITLIGFAAFDQALALGQLVGIALIVAGVVLIQLSSRVAGRRAR